MSACPRCGQPIGQKSCGGNMLDCPYTAKSSMATIWSQPIGRPWWLGGGRVRKPTKRQLEREARALKRREARMQFGARIMWWAVIAAIVYSVYSCYGPQHP